VVPGWYGCTCIKWVDRIELVGEDQPATAQMIEFASRTHQPEAFALARDYLPAEIDQAAMPVRIERWRTGGGELYRVIGILWGGKRPTTALEIRFQNGGQWKPVDVCQPPATNATWTLWTHAWAPPAPGRYEISLRITDPEIRTRRLDAGHYRRSVEI
jgi:DMSO/TMAO reductase YedYZ molybdopterin-dependent catalytic subunit